MSQTNIETMTKGALTVYEQYRIVFGGVESAIYSWLNKYMNCAASKY